MRALIASGLVAAAVVGTIALVPASSWVFKNQLDILFRFDPDNNPPYSDVFEVFAPKWLVNPDTYTGSSDSEQLAHALLQGDSNRLKALQSFAASHPGDSVAWTLVVRLAATRGNRTPDSPPDAGLASRKQDDEAMATGIEASRKGETLEPNNAYFPIMRAAFEMDENRLDEMRAALKDAAAKSGFNNHVRDEGRILSKALANAKGYRGELLRIAMESSIMLPDLSHIGSMARYINRHGSLSEKRDVIEAAYLQAKGDQTAIGFLVAYKELRYILREPLPLKVRSEPIPTDSEFLTMASRFDDRLKAAKVAPPVPGTLAVYQTVSRLCAAMQKYIPRQPAIFATQQDSDGNAELSIYYQTVAPYFGLLCLLAAAALGYLASVFARVKSDQLIGLMPYLLPIPAWIISALIFRACLGCDPLPVFGAAIGATQLSLGFLRFEKRVATNLTALIAAVGVVGFATSSLVLNSLAVAVVFLTILIAAASWLLNAEQRVTTAKLCGALIAVGSILLVKVDSSAALGGLMYLIASGLLWKNKEGQTPKYLTAVSMILFLLMAAAVGVVTTWQIFSYRLLDGYEIGGMAIIIVAALFTGRPIDAVKKSACISLFLFSGLYLASVGWELRGNHELSMGKHTFLNEADNIRALAGVRP